MMTKSLCLTKIPDIKKSISVSSAGQQASISSDVEDNSSAENTDTVSRGSCKTNTPHSAGTPQTAARHDQQISLEMPTSVTSANGINLNFERTCVVSRGRVRGTAASNRTAASRSASHRKKH